MTKNTKTTESKIRDKEEKIKRAEERLERQKKQVQKERRILSDKRRKEFNHRTYVLGGLVRKADLGDIDNETLLGIFLKMSEILSSPDLDNNKVDLWRERGRKALNYAEQRVQARLEISEEECPDRSELAKIRELGFRKKSKRIWEGKVLKEKADLYAYEYGRNVEFLRNS